MKHYKLDEWLIFPESQRGIKNGQEVKLEPKMLEVLLCLIEHKGQTVSKSYLMENVWKDIIVTDHSLNKTISKLRKVFNDSPKDSKVIETISKKGYRLLVPVEVVNETAFVENDIEQRFKENKPRFLVLGLVIGISILMILLLNYFFYNNNDDEKIEVPVIAGKIIPFTTSPGLELMPTFSNNGQDLAFIQYSEDNQINNIFSKNINENAAVQLTNSKGIKLWPKFSPDGKHIAYFKRIGNQLAVCIISSEGKKEYKLIDLKTQSPQGLSWSPDGNYLVYTDLIKEGTANALYILNIEDRTTKQLTFPELNTSGDEYPSFHPSGKRIVFIRRKTHEIENICLLEINNPEKPKLKILSDLPLHHTHGLCWSESGNEIMYFTNEGGSYVLKLQNPEGPFNEMLFIATSAYAKYPELSPDGNHMAFVQWEVKQNIYSAKINVSGVFKPEIKIQSTRTDGHATLSPDGNNILFSSNRYGKFEFWLANNKGQNLKQLTNISQDHEITARWSPNGDYIVYSILKDGKQPVYLLKVPEGLPVIIVEDGILPSFTKDGKSIFFTTSNKGIQKYSLSEKTTENILDINAFEVFESLNSEDLFFTKEKEKGVWKLDNKNAVSKLIPDFDGLHKSNWTVVENGIYYVKYQQGEPVLLFYDFSNNKTNSIGTLASKGLHIDGIDIKGNQITYTIIDQTQSDIMLIEFER